MKIKIDFIAGDSSLVEVKRVLDAGGQSFEEPAQPASLKKYKQLIRRRGRNQLAGLLLKTKQPNINQERKLYV
jgi:hypothetical protein